MVVTRKLICVGDGGEALNTFGEANLFRGKQNSVNVKIFALVGRDGFVKGLDIWKEW